MSVDYVAFVTGLESRPGEVIVGRMYEEIRVCTLHLGELVSELKKKLYYRREHEEEEDDRGTYVVAMNSRLLHASLGMLDESCEMFDRVWTDILGTEEHGELPPDRTNWLEELGDLTFYQTMAEDALGFTHQTVIDANVAKLEARYPGGFSNAKSENRDRANERQVLEGAANAAA